MWSEGVYVEEESLKNISQAQKYPNPCLYSWVLPDLFCVAVKLAHMQLCWCQSASAAADSPPKTGAQSHWDEQSGPVLIKRSCHCVGLKDREREAERSKGWRRRNGERRVRDTKTETGRRRTHYRRLSMPLLYQKCSCCIDVLMCCSIYTHLWLIGYLLKEWRWGKGRDRELCLKDFPLVISDTPEENHCVLNMTVMFPKRGGTELWCIPNQTHIHIHKHLSVWSF